MEHAELTGSTSMPSLRALVLVVVACLVSSLAPASAAPLAQKRTAAFEPVPCANFKIKNSAFECGTVHVPEQHAQPDGKQIQLGVAILPGTRGSPTRDAFVMAQGGPGGSTIDLFSQFLVLGSYPALNDLREERDIVLYDQRGTLYARPALTCPEELQNTFDTIEKDLPPDEADRLDEQAALACRDRLAGTGINLAAFNSLENALDIEDVRRALGYAQFDFYGISYGTLLALHAMHETPASFRSVILDAVVPTQINPNATVPQTQNRAFQQLFGACAADTACQRAYPNLQQVFYQQVDALDKQPARVALTDGETGKTYNAVLDGDTYINLLFQFIYNSEIIPALPKMIYDVRDGSFNLLQAYWPLVAFDRTFASGMYYSVMCAEDADFTVNDLALDGVDPHIATMQKRDTAYFLDLCQKWKVPPLGPQADAPVRSTIPTLLLSGAFDPITPPPFGQTAASTITPSYPLVFPAYGHGALTSGNCPNQIVVAFVRDPLHAPDARCIQATAPLRFITPTNYLLSPALGKLQAALLQGQLLVLGVPLLLLGILLSVLLVGPLAWLIRRSQHRPPEANRWARGAPWFAALAGLLAAFFLAALFAILLYIAVRNDNAVGLVLGMPRTYLPLFVLPPLVTIATLLLCLAVLSAWRRGTWSVAGRVYYTVVACAALGLTLWFAANGILLALV